MSIHNRAAALYARRFTLTVTRYFRGCAQYFVFEGMTESEVETEKRYQRKTLPLGYEQAFDVSSC